MYDLDTYPDSVPDLCDLLRLPLPDETYTDAELARLEERDDVYRTLQSLGMLRYAHKTA